MDGQAMESTKMTDMIINAGKKIIIDEKLENISG